MNATTTVLLLLAAVSFGLASAIAADTKPDYSVAAYNPERDPVADLQTSLEIAKKDDRRVLVMAGGDWCGWCRRMDGIFKSNDAVSAILAKDYVVMKVNYSNKNQNSDFFAKYPDFPEFPHFFVFNQDGKLLKSQNPAEWGKTRRLPDRSGGRVLQNLGFEAIVLIEIRAYETSTPYFSGGSC